MFAILLALGAGYYVGKNGLPAFLTSSASLGSPVSAHLSEASLALEQARAFTARLSRKLDQRDCVGALNELLRAKAQLAIAQANVTGAGGTSALSTRQSAAVAEVTKRVAFAEMMYKRVCNCTGCR